VLWTTFGPGETQPGIEPGRVQNEKPMRDATLAHNLQKSLGNRFCSYRLPSVYSSSSRSELRQHDGNAAPMSSVGTPIHICGSAQSKLFRWSRSEVGRHLGGALRCVGLTRHNHVLGNGVWISTRRGRCGLWNLAATIQLQSAGSWTTTRPAGCRFVEHPP
jgi:hypothetical protein